MAGITTGKTVIINGPTNVSWGASTAGTGGSSTQFGVPLAPVAAGTLALLGQTDAESLITCNQIIHPFVVHTNDSGPQIPAYVYNLGSEWSISCPLVNFDQTEFQNLMLAYTGATVEGQFGKFQLSPLTISIAPTLPNAKIITLPYCFLLENPVEISGYGLGVKPVTHISFKCFTNAMPPVSSAPSAIITYN